MSLKVSICPLSGKVPLDWLIMMRSVENFFINLALDSQNTFGFNPLVLMQKHKFSRKKDNNVVEQELKKRYEPILRSLFRILALQRPKDEKILLIQKEYQTVGDKDIERNEIFISVLVDLKKGVEVKRSANPAVWESFRESMKLLKAAGIIDQTTFQELCGEIQEGFEEEPGLRAELTKRQREEANKVLLRLIEKKESIELRREKDSECEAIIDDLKQQINFQELDAGLIAEFWRMGSAKNGFALVDSDYDVAISTNNMESVDERAILNFFYSKAKNILQNRYYKEDFKIEKQIHEKIRIPIINLQIYVEPRIDISFTVNNELGVYNSHLLRTYSEFDQRCHNLGLLVKIWAQNQEVLSAKKQFLSSYAFILMVINFLQTLKEPILPTLQTPTRREPNTIKIMRKINNDKIDNFKAEIDFESDPEKLKLLKSKFSSNQQTNLDLLRKFFKFYSQDHKFGNIKLSIKKASHLQRSEREMDILYSIEDPFDLFHNPGWPLKKNSVQAERLLKVMRRSYELLKQNKVSEVFERINTK